MAGITFLTPWTFESSGTQTAISFVSKTAFSPMRLGVLRFNLIYLALVPARKQFIDENKLTFMKPLEE